MARRRRSNPSVSEPSVPSVVRSASSPSVVRQGPSVRSLLLQIHAASRDSVDPAVARPNLPPQSIRALTPRVDRSVYATSPNKRVDVQADQVRGQLFRAGLEKQSKVKQEFRHQVEARPPSTGLNLDDARSLGGAFRRSVVEVNGRPVPGAKKGAGRVEVAEAVPQQTCRQENRPASNRGSGGSRPFVPWCQKGK